MIDLTGASRFKDTDDSTSYLFGMVAICMVSKLTHVVPIDGNVLFSEVGLPNRLYVDTDSALEKIPQGHDSQHQ